MEKFAALGVNAWLDRANNAIALIKDRNPQKSIAITAHKKYEIGALENVGVMQALLDNHSECFLFLTQYSCCLNQVNRGLCWRRHSQAWFGTTASLHPKLTRTQLLIILKRDICS
jgi:hypothetical protein